MLLLQKEQEITTETGTTVVREVKNAYLGKTCSKPVEYAVLVLMHRELHIPWWLSNSGTTSQVGESDPETHSSSGLSTGMQNKVGKKKWRETFIDYSLTP